MKKYEITLKTDLGKFRVIVKAKSLSGAIKKVCKITVCKHNQITKITYTKEPI